MPPAVALCSSASPLSIPALVEHYPSACLLCLYPSFPLAVPVFGTSVHPFLLISVPLFFENILSLMTLGRYYTYSCIQLSGHPATGFASLNALISSATAFATFPADI